MQNIQYSSQKEVDFSLEKNDKPSNRTNKQELY